MPRGVLLQIFTVLVNIHERCGEVRFTRRGRLGHKARIVYESDNYAKAIKRRKRADVEQGIGTLKALRREFGLANSRILAQLLPESLSRLLAISLAANSIELKNPIEESDSLRDKLGRGIRLIFAERLRIEESFQAKEWFFEQMPGQCREGIARE